MPKDKLDLLELLTHTIQSHFFLPTTKIWDYAAFGKPQFTFDPANRYVSVKQSNFPLHMDNTALRTNENGLSDLIGNSWQWCQDQTNERFFTSVTRVDGKAHDVSKGEIRGGSYLDNLEKVTPRLRVKELANSWNTSHSDISFRICALLPATIVGPRTLTKLQNLQGSTHQWGWVEEELRNYTWFY